MNLHVEVTLAAPQAWPLAPAALNDIVTAAAKAVWREVASSALPNAVANEREDRSASLHVMLADEDMIRPLNASWRGRNTSTNVLSFSAPPMPVPPGEPVFLGEIVLGGEVIVREADQAGVSLQDQLAWMVVHGTLHILGYDHENAQDRAQMEALESAIMKCLGYEDPHAGD